jgi:hypothetical protein
MVPVRHEHDKPVRTSVFVDDGPEHADIFETAAELFHETERNDRLAAPGFETCDVQAFQHGSSPPWIAAVDTSHS